jgi:mercuric ion binding protein
MKKVCVALIALGLSWPALAATKTVTLEVRGWTCGSCAASTRTALKKLDGVENVKTDHEKMEAVVTYDDTKVTPEGLIQATEKVGYTAAVKTVVDGAPAVSAVSEGKKGDESVAPAEDMSFFQVPLGCAAAANLGCGSQAKPILRELEQDPRVASARINRAGTLLAIAWREPAQSRSGVPFIEGAFQKNDLEASNLQGADREKALMAYKAGQWYGSMEVDRLSEHEAEVIASRLVDRARLGLPPDVAASLKRDLSVLLAKHLTSDALKERAVVEEELAAAASKYLNESQMAALRKAGEEGVMALPGEIQ